MSEKKFLKNIHDPQKDANETRLAYAQWLEDRKDVRGEFLKLQIKLKTPRLSAAEKRKAKKRLEALEQEIDREWSKKVTVVPAVKCDRDWVSWISLETLNEHKLGRNRKVPVDAIVVSKSKEWVHDAEVSKVTTEFGVAQSRKIKWLGSKDEATQMNLPTPLNFLHQSVNQ